ncbi:hypothetical protein EDB87DRAFT_1631502 [Lactarius vividus]|nr:hypothetical protein EDB87DRAFT_1631502 [Lactarius vividus]
MSRAPAFSPCWQCHFAALADDNGGDENRYYYEEHGVALLSLSLPLMSRRSSHRGLDCTARAPACVQAWRSVPVGAGIVVVIGVGIAGGECWRSAPAASSLASPYGAPLSGDIWFVMLPSHGGDWECMLACGRWCGAKGRLRLCALQSVVGCVVFSADEAKNHEGMRIHRRV